MRTHAIIVALLCTPTASVVAQSADTIIVSVTLNRPDWTYRVGDFADFYVAVHRDGRDVPESRVVVAIAQERMKPMRVRITRCKEEVRGAT